MPVNYTGLGDQLRAASRLQPSPLDRSEGLLADQAGPFARSPAPMLFADTPLAGSTPTYADILAYWAQRDPRLQQMLRGAGGI